MAAFTQGQENNLGTHNANFKEVYADEVVSLIPSQFKVQKMIALELGEKEIGNHFNQPVIVADEQGVTYYTPDDGAADLNAAVPAQMKNAQVRDVAILVRTALATDILDRASKKGKKAFKSATELAVKSMRDCIAKRVEVACIYGGSTNGIGRITKSGSVPAATDSGRKVKLALTTGHWAPGIWAGAKNAKVQIYKQATGTLIGEYSIDSVDFSTKSLTFYNATSSVITDLRTALDTGGGNEDAIIRYSGSKDKEFLGLDVIVTNTGSLFGIDGATYDLWQGNETTSTGDLSLTKIFASIQKIVERGSEEKVVLLTSTRAWNLIMVQEMVTNRKLDNSYDKKNLDTGSENIRLFHALGEVEVVASLYVKEGDTFALTLKTLKRLGTKDIGFNQRGTDSEYFMQLPNNAGVELRCSTSQCLFCHAPLRNLKMSGITFPSGY